MLTGLSTLEAMARQVDRFLQRSPCVKRLQARLGGTRRFERLKKLGRHAAAG